MLDKIIMLLKAIDKKLLDILYPQDIPEELFPYDFNKYDDKKNGAK